MSPPPPPSAVPISLAGAAALLLCPPLAALAQDRPVVEVELTASVQQLSLLPGLLTGAYVYNGQVPGPTLEFMEGDRVVVRFRNELPEETTVHWHGLHLPFEADGSPFHPVGPGETWEYAFIVRPGSAGTYWYHPHPHHRTGAQVAKGLYGGIIVRAPDDPLPGELTEQLLILSDNRFLPDGSFDLPELHTHEWRVDFENGREGDVLFVNGQVMPTLTIRSGEVQRWRVVNASAGRSYRLALPGHTLMHVGSDGGLFERAVEVEEILLSPSERIEVLVRGVGEPGSRVALTSLPYDRYVPQTRPEDWDRPRDLLILAYTGDAAARSPRLPDVLRPVPALDPTAASATRLMVLTQGFINGQPLDMERVDVEARLGATEIWELENLVGMDHPFHLHGFQFQVLDRDGIPESFPSWKDTVNVPRHGTVRFIVRYDDHPGLWMFHCHILDHEDHGMMGVLRVH
jgi:FtsP/CotA-like multicopper oxidase with cupredoxin domain